MLDYEDLSGSNRFNSICVSLKKIENPAVKTGGYFLPTPLLMNSKLTRTVLIALALGFFAVWILEFRRAGLFESYWLLLLSVTSFLLFQFSRLKAAMMAKEKEQGKSVPEKIKSGKTARK